MKRIRVAAVQSGVDPLWTPAEWSNHLRWQLASCREAQVELAVFPAWTGAYQESFPRGYPEEALGTLIRLLGGLAREAGLHLVPGTIPIRCGDGVRLRSLLLSPAGELLGAQDQLCPPPGYAPGERLEAIETDLGRVALVSGDDGSVPEIGRILALQGADLLCAPAAYAAPYNPWRQAAGLWQIVQVNQVPAIEACLVGEFAGRSYRGRSRIIGTVEMSADGDGILAQARSTDGTEMVPGEVDPEALANSRASYAVFTQFNTDLYQRELAEALSGLAGGGHRRSAPADSPAAAGEPRRKEADRDEG